MVKFDKIVEELDWVKPYENVALWYKNNKSGGLKAVFDINKTCDIFINNEDKLTVEYVQGSLNFFPKTVFSQDSMNWVLPLLASDYFAHREDFENELLWAKKAMKENKELTSLQFSLNIREQL